ncbi:Protein STB2 [Psilocybe cubensis]|uniref:STB6-like N-terminal domain-containing protein n=2 Tax=Psilocybe cubensis TaxID=181762 RepID=A0A8H7Y140_PSICU|nr:Protein STB2 [Psilocybe cubensis]KAH9482681.1 Protein STB2 [Psilocybe cubensis]
MPNHDLILLAPHAVRPPPQFEFASAKPQILLPQYQLYAVQRWVEQRRPFPCLLVYTANDDHRVLLDALAPATPAVWDSTLALLRADGARPKQTPHGTLIVTSLAHFRSDYNIVLVPDGNYATVQHQLHANISLLRMGCSPRAALSLEDPSDATRERFVSAYSLPDPDPHNPQAPAPGPRPRPRPALRHTVLELVKLIQASLALFGLYPSASASSVPQSLVLDGLLCDQTVQGIRIWTARVGAPCVGLEPTERIADPLFVSAILTLVLSVRNKLAYLGYSFILPRDPFLYPYAFSLAISHYIQSTAPHPPQNNRTFSTPHLSIHVSTPLIPPAPPPTNFLSASAASAAAAATIQSLPVGAVLTRELVESISAAYDAKLKAENRKVRRVIKNRLAAAADSDGAADSSDILLRDQRRHTLSLTLSGGEAASDRSPAQAGLAEGSSSVPSIGSSGGQLLSGIGSSLARLTTTGTTHGDPGAVMSPTLDLPGFVTLAVGTGASSFSRREKRARRKSKERARRGESMDIGTGSAALYERERDHVIAGTIRALWSGRVMELVRMREDAEGTSAAHRLGMGHGDSRTVLAERDKWTRRGPASDGEESWKEKRGYDGRSTEEESDVFNSNSTSMPGSVHSFGGMWGGRVRGKLGTWAGLAKKKTQSVDLSQTPPALSTPLKGKEKEREQLSVSPNNLVPVNAGPPHPPPRLVISGSGSMSSRPSASRRSTTTGSGAQSPTLPPMVFSGEGDDDDLLSSGQVSPLSDYRPNPFNMLSSASNSHTLASAEGSTTNLAGISSQEYERTLAKLLAQKRPWTDRRVPQTARVASWADPLSASTKDEEDEEEDEADEGEEVASMRSFEKRYPRSRSPGKAPHRRERDSEAEESDVSRLGPSLKRKGKEKEKARFHSLLSVMDGEGMLVEEPMEQSEYEDEEDAYSMDEVDIEGIWKKRRRAGFEPRRRRSFHDLKTFEGIEVLTPEWMKIDVDICGHLLIIRRREEHLRNVITCARLVTQSLSKINLAQRQHYETHLPTLSKIAADSTILNDLETERLRSLKIVQSTNTLEYESAQFLVDDLWQTAGQSRRKVFELREKVFGTGGRRLPAGVHGAHGPFNRLQWTLDGRSRVVDYRGRTESEAEEESRLDELPSVLPMDAPATPLEKKRELPPDEDEGDVVEHPGIKPMWLLRFFTSWGARWSVATAATSAAATPSPSGALSPTPIQKENSGESAPRNNEEARHQSKPNHDSTDPGGEKPEMKNTLPESPSA